MSDETRVPLADLLAVMRPGSGDWSWDDEERDLLGAVCVCCETPGGYQLRLEQHLRTVGRVEQGVCLGNDGRIWDGHHRIVAARRLGFPDIPLEPDSYPLPSPPAVPAAPREGETKGDVPFERHALAVAAVVLGQPGDGEKR